MGQGGKATLSVHNINSNPANIENFAGLAESAFQPPEGGYCL